MEIAHVRVAGQSVRVTHYRPLVALTQGAKVVFDFDESWDGLTRTLVWRAGDITVDDASLTGTIPAAVLEKSGCDLFVGIYGTGEATALPTLWAHLGYIHPGADPSGDPATDPGLPLWAQVADKSQAALDTAQEALRAAAETESFTARYGITSHAEILDAHRAGKICFCADGQGFFLLSQADGEKAVFTAWDGHGFYYRRVCTAPNAWKAEYEAYLKADSVTANSTDDQIPTAAAVYKALQSAKDEPEIYIGYRQTSTWGELSRQIGYGKLVFVQENTVTRRLYQHYGQEGDGALRFYRVDGDGIHYLAVDQNDVWSQGSLEDTAPELYQVRNGADGLSEIRSAVDAGKLCWYPSGGRIFTLTNISDAEAVFMAYNPASYTVYHAKVDAGGLWSSGSYRMEPVSEIPATMYGNRLATVEAVRGYVSQSLAGKVGEDGGYYTPEFIEIGGGTVHVNFVKSKDTMPDAPSTNFTAPQGEAGKSAYLYAQEAGFTGTEAEFAAMLAREPEVFLIHVTTNPDGTTADKTYAEIRDAISAGKLVAMKHGYMLHAPMGSDANGILFYPLPTAYSAPSANKKWTVTSADVWSQEEAAVPLSVTSVSASSTDARVPTAKAVYDAIAAKHQKYQRIRSLEVTEPVRKLEFTDLNLDELTIFMVAPKVETAIGHDVYVYNTEGTSVFYHWPSGGIYTDYPRNSCWHMNRKKGYVEGFYSIQTIASASHTLAPKGSMMTHSFVDGSLPFDRIKMDTYDDTKLFPVGLKIEIWGIPAHG